MTLAVVLVVPVVLVAGVVVGFLVRNRSELQRDMSELKTERVKLLRRLAVAEDELSACRESAEEQRQDYERRIEALTLADAPTAADSPTEAAEAPSDHEPTDSLVPTTTAGTEPVGPPSRGAGGAWVLLLADLDRRWAATVGAPPSARGVPDVSVADQLAHCMEHEIERLREEVGVAAEFTRSGQVEPVDPVVFLLAATDLLGVLATTCQRVTAHIEGNLVLTGEDRETGDDDDLKRAQTRAQAAGIRIEPSAPDADTVHITMHPH
jgi:hypothetical protein